MSVTFDQDLFQPYLAAINDPLLAPFDALPQAAHVVDLACGTGEPALSLARRRPDLRITGIDTDAELLALARAKAGHGLATAGFRVMPMEELSFADGSIDGIVSRMGLLMPGLVPFAAAVREAGRVLRPGGRLSLATWTDPASNPYTGVGLPVLRKVLPEGTVPDFEARFAESAREGALEKYLSDEGFGQIEGSWFAWETHCPDFETWWTFSTGAGRLNPLFAALDADQRLAARKAMADLIDDYRAPSGGYRMPSRCRIITARRGAGTAQG